MNKYIYEIRNIITKESYIGIRECECEIEKDKYKGENTRLSKEFKKHGKKNFHKRVLAIIIKEKMKDELLDLYLNNSKYILLEESSGEEFITKRSSVGARNGASRKVVCLNTEEIFDTITEASKRYGVTKSGIVQCCNPNCKTSFAGKDSNGEPLKWMYHDAYMAQMNGEEFIYSSKMAPKNVRTVKVRCVETGEVFNSIKEASEKYNIHSGSISNSCLVGNNAGKHPDTGASLSWEYVDSF